MYYSKWASTQHNFGKHSDSKAIEKERQTIPLTTRNAWISPGTKKYFHEAKKNETKSKSKLATTRGVWFPVNDECVIAFTTNDESVSETLNIEWIPCDKVDRVIQYKTDNASVDTASTLDSRKKDTADFKSGSSVDQSSSLDSRKEKKTVIRKKDAVDSKSGNSVDKSSSFETTAVKSMVKVKSMVNLLKDVMECNMDEVYSRLSTSPDEDKGEIKSKIRTTVDKKSTSNNKIENKSVECKTDNKVDTSSSSDEEETIKLKGNGGFPGGPIAFGGCHILINKERKKKGLKPLHRERILEEAASNHAKVIANEKKLTHSDIKATMKSILSSGSCSLIGESLGRGKIAQIVVDRMMLHSPQDRNNILDQRYSTFGIGSARCSSGDLYIVQIYKG
mmetsp:Transcript_17620/g.21553  ORF Transcript_17620/g.21553 Transcript_17620/m.21553 type:complete len:392 (+) Transcript_17620:180-1355(+)